MPSEAVQQLLERGERSGLISTAAAQELISQLTASEAITVDEVAAQMIEKKVLTRYQADQLLAGHGEECLVAGRYRILDKLGQGGMGAVYKAHDTHLDRDVAVKVLPGHHLNDADAVARFQREARALAKLSHPNIIQAYDSGEDKGKHFLVMEYVAGASLAAILRERGALPPTLAADMIYQAALGLQHAHAKGLVHRDLKPGNLLWSAVQLLPDSRASASKGQTRPSRQLTTSYVAPDAVPRGVVKILDLGLARFLQDQLGNSQVTKEGAGVGTPDYMAPEQFRDALHADATTDIYGLGCTLYHLISGTVPFPGSSYSEKADAHAKKEPIPLEERCPEVPVGLAFVVSKMMAKHPANRFQTAGEVAEALAPYIAGASHSAIQLRQTMRFHAGQLTTRSPSRRKRLLVWAGAAVAAACFVGLLILAGPSFFRRGTHEPPNDAPVESTERVAKTTEPALPKVITIPNGLTVAKDGTGQYSTIGDALAKVQKGMTIRVLDDATYPEVISLDSSPERLARVTIEAPKRATLKLPQGKPRLLAIRDTPGVRVTGFRLREQAAASGRVFVAITGHTPGVVLEDLDLQSTAEVIGAVINVELKEDEKPIVVRRCSFDTAGEGIVVGGATAASPEGRSSGGVLISENRIMNSSYRGVVLIGRLRRVLVVGNLVTGCGQGLQTQDLGAESEGILFANNTSYANGYAFRYWLSTKPTFTIPERQVELANNLLFASDNSDMACIHGVQGAWAIPDVAKELAERWRFARNWRDLVGAHAHLLIPLAGTDERLPRPDGLSRDSNDPNFLRPAADSPLAKGGAGGDLPTYVGAVPPEGDEPWNWQKTWDARVAKSANATKTGKD
jgi:serine/threonine protein kinase